MPLEPIGCARRLMGQIELSAYLMGIDKHIPDCVEQYIRLKA